MKKIIYLFLKKPYISIIIILLILGFGIVNIRKLNIDTSERSLILQKDKDLTYYDDTIEKFVSDNIELIYIEDDNLFTYDKLKKIEDLIVKLYEIKGIDNIESLFNVTNIKNKDDLLTFDHFFDYIPEDENEIETLKKDALSNPIIVDNLISKDGKKFIIKLYLNDEEVKKDKLFEINTVKKIEKILKNYKPEFKDIFQTGNPFVKKSIYDTIQRDGKIIFPIALLILLIMLIITLRSLHGGILPFITSAISVVTTIGFMSLVKIPLNLLTFIIPSLIIVIGSTEDIHILAEYFEGIKQKKDRNKAIFYLAGKIGIAIFITATTTFLGFLSISINKILVLRQFGIAASFGLLINPIITVLISPVYLRFFGPKKESENNLLLHIDNIFEAISDFITDIVVKYNKIIIIIFSVITIIFGLFIFKVKLEYDLLNNFKENSIVNKNINKFEKNLTGINSFFLRVKLHNDNTFLAPDNLKTIDNLITALRNIKEIDKIISVTDYIKLFNKEINFGNSTEYRIPDTEGAISEYFMFLDPVEIQKYITYDYTEVNIIIKHGITSSNELNKLINKINKITPGFTDKIGDYRLSGFQLLTKKSSYSIATGTIQGILLLTLIIFIIMSILFFNIKAGFISLVTNSFPIIFNFGLMGILNIPLNIGSCLVGVIALGLAVDDTIHLMSKYKIDMRAYQDNMLGIKATIKSELRPAFSTSISLASLFFMLCISNLVNIKNFGFLSGFVILYAFFCDIFLTTTLLSKTQLITLIDILTLKVKKEILNSKLLTGLKLRQVKELILLGAVREVKKGEFIMKHNSIGNTINIILEGSVEVSVMRGKKKIVFTEFKEGDIIGEIAVLIPVKRSADIIAKTHVKYFEVDDKGLKRIEKIKPKIAKIIYHNISVILAERLLHLNKKYIEDVDINQWHGAYKD